MSAFPTLFSGAQAGLGRASSLFDAMLQRELQARMQRNALLQQRAEAARQRQFQKRQQETAQRKARQQQLTGMGISLGANILGGAVGGAAASGASGDVVGAGANLARIPFGAAGSAAVQGAGGNVPGALGEVASIPAGSVGRTLTTGGLQALDGGGGVGAGRVSMNLTTPQTSLNNATFQEILKPGSVPTNVFRGPRIAGPGLDTRGMSLSDLSSGVGVPAAQPSPGVSPSSSTRTIGMGSTYGIYENPNAPLPEIERQAQATLGHPNFYPLAAVGNNAARPNFFQRHPAFTGGLLGAADALGGTNLAGGFVNDLRNAPMRALQMEDMRSRIAERGTGSPLDALRADQIRAQTRAAQALEERRRRATTQPTRGGSEAERLMQIPEDQRTGEQSKRLKRFLEGGGTAAIGARGPLSDDQIESEMTELIRDISSSPTASDPRGADVRHKLMTNWLNKNQTRMTAEQRRAVIDELRRRFAFDFRE